MRRFLVVCLTLLSSTKVWAEIVIPTIIVNDEGSFIIRAGSMNFVGSGVAVSSTGRGAIITVSGGGAGGADNLGTHIASQTLNMNTHSIINANEVRAASYTVESSNDYMEIISSQPTIYEKVPGSTVTVARSSWTVNLNDSVIPAFIVTQTSSSVNGGLYVTSNTIQVGGYTITFDSAPKTNGTQGFPVYLQNGHAYLGSDNAGSGSGGNTSLPLPGGGTNYIQNTNTLQDGASFYVTNATITQIVTSSVSYMNPGTQIQNMHLVQKSVPDFELIGSTYPLTQVSTLSVTFPVRKSLRIVVYSSKTTNALNNVLIGWNGDYLANQSSYTLTRNSNAANQASATARGALLETAVASGEQRFFNILVPHNSTSTDKLAVYTGVIGVINPPTGNPTNVHGAIQWRNQAEAINRIDMVQYGAPPSPIANFSEGSFIEVYGSTRELPMIGAPP